MKQARWRESAMSQRWLWPILLLSLILNGYLLLQSRGQLAHDLPNLEVAREYLGSAERGLAFTINEAPNTAATLILQVITLEKGKTLLLADARQSDDPSLTKAASKVDNSSTLLQPIAFQGGELDPQELEVVKRAHGEIVAAIALLEKRK
jgi:hypothetical protein